MAVTATHRGIWLVVWHHRHGEDYWVCLGHGRPTDEEAEEAVEGLSGGAFEPAMGEWVEVRYVPMYDRP